MPAAGRATSGTSAAKSPKPKLSQIARLANVSVTTASRALTGKGRVNDETIVKVRTVAQMLGYPTKPSTVNEQNSRLVVMVTHPLTQLAGSDGLEQTHTYWFRLYYGLINTLTARGTGLVWTTTDSQNLMIPLPVSAILLSSLEVPRPDIIDLGYDVPILVSGVPHESDDPRIRGYLGYDNEQTSMDACEHLAKAGAKKLAVLVRPAVGAPATQWVSGYERWCESQGQEPVVLLDNLDDQELVTAVQSAIDSGVDGFYIAMPSPSVPLRAIREHGKVIPTDVQVVTWEETTEFPDQIPEFTRIAPKALDASVVIADAIDLLTANPQRQLIYFDYQLIQGRSTLTP